MTVYLNKLETIRKELANCRVGQTQITTRLEDKEKELGDLLKEAKDKCGIDIRGPEDIEVLREAISTLEVKMALLETEILGLLNK